MSRTVPVNMSGRTLTPEFSLGPLRFTNADSLPLEEMFCSVEENEITLRLSGHFPSDSPWRGSSMVVFFLYRLPDSSEEFNETIHQFKKNEKKSVRLPENQPFDETVLALSNVPPEWEHDCFATDIRNLFHVYRSAEVGVMVRWFSKMGTMLDHPLLSLVRENVRLVDEQWETETPTTLQEASDEVEDYDEDIPLVLHLDLRIEQQKIRQFVEQRIRDYPNRENYGPGEPGDPVHLITLGFYAEQTGYVSLVLDTRPDAEVDGAWTTFLDDDLNILDVPEWHGLYMAVCEEQTVTVIAHDGTERVVTENDISDEELNALFGEMLTALMQDLRENGSLAKLPLHPEAYFVIEEFDGRYFWPTYDTRKTQGAIRG